MNIQQRCREAIHSVGAAAALVTREGPLYFTASIQPILGTQEETGSCLGWGAARRYRLYTPWDGVAKSLGKGDAISWGGKRFVVHWVEEFLVRGKPAYIQGMVQLEEEL